LSDEGFVAISVIGAVGKKRLYFSPRASRGALNFFVV
jgi:hypothetical protein